MSPNDNDPRPMPPVRPSVEDCCKGSCYPRIFDVYVEALRRPWMKDARWREPGLDEFQHPLPRHGGLLATPRQRAFPQYRDVVAESHECPGVRGHCVVGEESRRDLPQPVPLFGDWVVHPPPQFVLHSPKCRSHAVASGLPENLELSLACMPANERETQKG